MQGTTIAAVRTHVLEHMLDVPFQSASARFDRRTHLLVEVECADGTVGWGECLGPVGPNAATVQAYAGWAVGMNALETERVWIALYNALRDQGQRGIAITALSGIDMALWDIRGKAAGLPVSMLLGGRFRERVRAYATGSFMRDGIDRIADVSDELTGYRAEGFHAAKIKIGFGVREDLALIAAARDAMGPEMRLMIDANHGYDVVEAVQLGRSAAEHDVDWFEEPILPELLDAYAEVRRAQPIPVAGGETWHGRWAMKAAIERRSVDILQPDLAGCGGFTEARRIADLCALHGVRLVPHVWGTGVQIAAALQFMAALVPDPFRPAPVEPILEFDRTHNPFRQAVLTRPIEHVDGWVSIPDAPGLGIEVNREALRTFAPKR